MQFLLFQAINLMHNVVPTVLYIRHLALLHKASVKKDWKYDSI